MDRKRCTRCNVLLPLPHFDIKRTGDYYKTCRHCSDVKKAYIKRKNNNIVIRNEVDTIRFEDL